MSKNLLPFPSSRATQPDFMVVQGAPVEIRVGEQRYLLAVTVSAQKIRPRPASVTVLPSPKAVQRKRRPKKNRRRHPSR